jgi:prepilin-type N-terminal cleavage/methylation domain-containing protein
MEMKHRQKHISLRCSNQGFTMIELLVAMVVSLLAMAAIYSTFLAQHRSYQVQTEAADMQQNIRAAMYYMQREIRMAGDNPFKSLPLSNFGFTPTGARQNSITFTEDVNSGGTPPGNPSTGAPDGFLTGDNENITYALNGTNLVRTDNNIPIGNPNRNQVVAQNIDWLDFVYLDGSNPPNILNDYSGTGAVPAANINQIRSVEITIVARTRDRLLYGTVNNNTYPNQQGTASWTAPGDNVSRRTLTAQIYCRNLDL